MVSALFKIEHVVRTSPITKTWDVVLYSSDVIAGTAGITVYRICFKRGIMQTFKTTGILHVDEIDKGVNMINTGPCRYIALNAAKYKSNESYIKIAYSKEVPIEGNMLQVDLLDFGNGTPTSFVPTSLEIEKPQKLSNNIYTMQTATERYFIVVE